jgi:uncharacterized protein YdeI (YjbR/CyaY-like superfamily)
LVSLHPVGGGRHSLRVKAQVRKEVDLHEGEPARVQITVLNQEVEIPPDLAKALRAERALKDFESIPPGERRYTIRLIDDAARPETRAKRIQAAVTSAHQRRERRADRGA